MDATVASKRQKLCEITKEYSAARKDNKKHLLDLAYIHAKAIADLVHKNEAAETQTLTTRNVNQSLNTKSITETSRKRSREHTKQDQQTSQQAQNQKNTQVKATESPPANQQPHQHNLQHDQQLHRPHQQDPTQNDQHRQRKQPKRFWCKDWYLRRPTYGWFNTLVKELQEGRQFDHPNDFKRFLRVDAELFTQILENVGPHIIKQDTNFRAAISPAERLAITLRFLAAGSISIEFGYRVSRASVIKIIPETVRAIIEVYGHLIHLPANVAEWRQVAQRFGDRWNYDLCLGALDGKHIDISCPPKSGSVYRNYKKFFSIILMALVDADYRFMYIDVGAEGHLSDSNVWEESDLNHDIDDGTIKLPPDTTLPGDTVPLPYHFLADNGFHIKATTLTPYLKIQSKSGDNSERIYNYRHSRARKVVECAFGVLAQRFRVLLNTLECHPEKAELIVHAACILHNLLIQERPKAYLNNIQRVNVARGVHDVEWHDREVLTVIKRDGRRKPKTKFHNAVRDHIKKYFMTTGAVPWQERMAQLQANR